MVGRLAAAHEAIKWGYGIESYSGPSGKLRHWRISGIPEAVTALHSKLGEQIGERSTRHQLGDDVGDAGVLAHIVDSDDVGVVAQEGHGPRLALDALAPGVVEAVDLHHRHGHLAPQTGVGGGIDAFACSFTKHGLDAVAATADRRRRR
jgi:hypothetical protein